MTETTFAEAGDEYVHLVCAPLGVGLCGQYQEEVIWFSLPCSVCQLIHTMQKPGTCAMKEGPCDCFNDT